MNFQHMLKVRLHPRWTLGVIGDVPKRFGGAYTDHMLNICWIYTKYIRSAPEASPGGWSPGLQSTRIHPFIQRNWITAQTTAHYDCALLLPLPFGHITIPYAEHMLYITRKLCDKRFRFCGLRFFFTPDEGLAYAEHSRSPRLSTSFTPAEL